MTSYDVDPEIGECGFKKPPKNPRASARAKLRRRLAWLQAALHEVETSIDDVIAAPGRTNKRTELESIKTAIAAFRGATGLTGVGLPEIPPIPDDLLARLFVDPSSNLPAYEANTAPFIAEIGLSPAEDAE